MDSENSEAAPHPNRPLLPLCTRALTPPRLFKWARIALDASVASKEGFCRRESVYFCSWSVAFFRHLVKHPAPGSSTVRRNSQEFM
jgi:hypothetical protein